jgi:hypothetical protein
MQIITKLLKSILPEFIIILAVYITVIIYLLPVDITIKGDGQGYYDYLPSIFIYKDFPNKGIDNSNEISARVKNLDMYIDYGTCKINKYPCGTALLMSPFFVGANLLAPELKTAQDGYSAPYQKAIYLAALFYLMLGLIFLKKLLELYGIPKGIIFLTQVLAAFGTGLTHYTYCDSSYSHVYSFFAITSFLFFTKSYFLTKKNKWFLFAALSLGLVVLLRQMNILIIFFVPFISDSFSNFKEIITYTIKKRSLLIFGIFSFIGMFSIQSILWYLETGRFFIYSYQGEGFNFLHPAFFKVLFSYKKGLFIYTPLLFFSLIGLYLLFAKKKYFQIISWIIFFFILTYFISSWGYWSYGASFGHRAYIDYYSIFLILIAITFNDLKSIWRWGFILLCISSIALNMVQTKQYNLFILHWGEMEKSSYWKVFLKLDHRYQGFLWKKTYYFDENTTKYQDSVLVDKIIIQPKSWTPILIENANKFCSFDSTNIIQISFKNKFSSHEKSKIVVSITDTVSNNIAYYHEAPLIHFPDNNMLDGYKEGVFNFEFTPIIMTDRHVIKIYAKTERKELILDEFKIRMIGYLF